MSNNTNRPVYRFSDNATSSQANEYGNYIIKRGMGEIRRPTWNRTETVVRFLPQWNFDENRWEPFRRSPAPMDFGDWIRRYDAVRGFGENGITMLLYDPLTNPSYDLQTNPCVILYRAINASITNKTCEPDWPALLKGEANRRAPLSRTQSIYIARVGIFRIKSKDMATNERAPLGLAGTDQAFFFELPKTAGEKLISLLETRVEGYEGDPEDYAKAYKHGDIVSLDQGAYVHFFEEGADPREEVSYASGAAPRQLSIPTGGRSSGGGGTTGFKSFDLYIEPNWRGLAPSLDTPELERLVRSKQRPWDECLNFLSHQEQAFLIQDGFPASAIMYAWRDHPEWIKDETRAKSVNRVSVGVDSGVNQRQAYQRPPANEGFAGFKRAVEQVVNNQPTQQPTEAPQEQGVVGGWGQAPAQEEAGKDSIVPAGLPDGVPTDGVDAALGQVPVKEREQKALAAMAAAKEAAKARAARG